MARFRLSNIIDPFGADRCSPLGRLLRKIAKNLGVVFSSIFLAMICNLAASALNVRVIGVDGVGVLVLIQAKTMLLAGFVSLPTPQPVIKLGRFALEARDSQKCRRIVGLGFIADMLGGCIAVAVTAALIISTPRWILPFDGSIVFAAPWLLVVLTQPLQTPEAVFRLLDAFRFVRLRIVLTAMLQLLASCALALTGASLLAYIFWYGAIISGVWIFTALLAFFLLRRHQLHPTRRAICAFSRGEVREFFAYAGITYLARIPNNLRRHLDVIILGAFGGANASGTYGIIRQVAGAVQKLNGLLTLVFFPEVARLAAIDDRSLARQMFLAATTGALGVGIVAVVCAAIFGADLLHLFFGDELVAAKSALVLMFIAAAITVSSSTFGGFIQAFSSPTNLILPVYLAFGFYMIFIVPLVIAMGVEGAATAQIVYASIFWLAGSKRVWTLLAAPRAATPGQFRNEGAAK